MFYPSRTLTISVSLVFFSLFAINPVFAADNSKAKEYQGKLDDLHQSIDTVKENLQGTRSKRGNTMTELRQLELKISKNSRAIKNINKEVTRLSLRIASTGKELQQLTRALDKQRSILADQLRSAYVQGQQHQLKMLLNQQDPTELGRIQVYFEYLNRARQEQIRVFIESIERKQTLEADLDKSRKDRQLALKDQAQQKAQLESQRVQRNKLLASLDIEIHNQEKTLTELESSRNKIENLLMSLGELLADIPANPNDKQDFAKLKGRLPWPVKGKMLARYGADKEQGGLKWRGILIAADYGTPVQAIGSGRVAFADWLQGFGFITIVDHGDGYMSLYGHNETLLKQAGDWVRAGEVIATSGDSGGQPRPGVYFEIRSRGKPVNPNNWCSSKIAQAVIP